MVYPPATIEDNEPSLREPTLSDLLDDARSGDVLAARQVLSILAEVIGRESPAPDCVRKYLSHALTQIAAGGDANRALHLVKRGSKVWSREDRRMAVDIVEQLTAQGLTIEEACGLAADHITANAATRLHSPWRRFARRGVDAKTLHNWYYAAKRRT